MNQDVSCRITNSIIQFARRENKAFQSLFEDVSYPLEYLVDTNSWIDRPSIHKIYKKLPSLFQDDNIIYHIGVQSPGLGAWGVLDSVFRMIGEPKLIYHQSRKFISYFYKNVFVRLSQKEEHALEVEFDSSLDALDVQYLQGALAGIPEYWNLGPAEIEKKSSHACHLVWQPKPGLFGDLKIPTHRSPRLIQEAVDKLEEQNEKLEKTNRELKEANRKLKDKMKESVQTEKMSSIGQLATGIAHEINNPLSFIMGNVSRVREYGMKLFQVLDLYEQLAQELPAEKTTRMDRILRKIDEMRQEYGLPSMREDFPMMMIETSEGLARVKQIVSDLNHFAHAGMESKEECSVHQCLDTALNMLRYDLKRRVHITKDYGDIPPLLCFPSQLNQVFFNLLLNAFQSIEGQGSIRICTFKEADWITITIKDSGCGIAEENREKIFEPFFTTKKPGEGTGLGLSTAFGLVRKHEGLIEVESQKGVGSLFRVKLPVCEKKMVKDGLY
ncbi:MAG: hypothetical protein HYS98_03380 [Deltaproteobacteria bacterium]|nr:hypothetical protein [Deltaproteobacteria bacterium]